MAKVKYNAVLNRFESVNVLKDVLDSGNSTTGFDIQVTHGDSIIGELSGNGSAGGDVSVLGGNSVSGIGGDAILAGGVSTATTGGNAFLAGGVGVSGGDVFIDGGLSNTTDNLSGDVIIQNLKFPRVDGNSGDVIATDGNGNLSFTAPTSGGNTSQVNSTKLITSTDSPYIVLASDFTIRADTTSGAIIVNIPPTATTVGRILNIKSVNNTNNVTVSGDGSELIDGSNIFMLTSLFESVTVQANGTNWDVI